MNINDFNSSCQNTGVKISESKWHYVIYTNGQDYWDYIFNDLKSVDDVEIISNPLVYNNCPKFLQLLHRVHYNGRLNRFIEIPYKNYWNRWYSPNSKTEKPICFIFMMTWLNPVYEPFFLYLKSTFSNCMIVLYLEDIISSRAEGAFSYDILNKYIDKVISYDKNEAINNGYYYYPTFMSKIALPHNSNSQKKDLFFCGAAKNRYSQILEMYRKVKDSGLTIDCSIARLSPNEKRYESEDITYIDYVWPYSTYLEHLESCNCIVELMQPNASGYTLRTWEALIFNKKLITNNKAILTAPFYRPEQFLYTESFESSTLLTFIQTPFMETDESVIKSLSPLNFLNFIENKILR